MAKLRRPLTFFALFFFVTLISSAQPTNGLIAYYPLDGNANDASGHNLNGTAFNGVTYVLHLSGQAAHLSGDSQYVSLPGTVPNTTDFTIAFWVKTSVSTPNTFPWGQFLVSRDLAFPNYDWNICIGQGRKIEFHTGRPFDDSAVLTSPNDIASNQWVHVTCIANSAEATKRLYLDGQLVASASWTPHAFDNGGVPIYLGSATAGQELHPYLPADMDEVRIYNRPLSNDEVATFYSGGGTSPPPPLSSNLVAYYPLEGNANDASGHNLNGTAYNDVTYVPHLLGRAAHLSGDSQYVSLPGTIPNSTDFTVAFWVKTSVSTSNTFPWGQYLVSRDLPFANYDWSIGIGQGRKIEFHTGTTFNDSLVLASPKDIASNEWVHVACVANAVGAAKRLYLNGQLVASTNWTPHAFDNTGWPIYIGNSPGSEDLHPYFPGNIDEVRIYNRSLSDEEIQTVFMDNGTPLPPLSAAVAFYPLEGNVKDASGFQNDGTAPNGISYVRHLSGQAAHLSGDSQYIAFPGTIPNTPDFTVTFWVKTSVSTSNSFPWGQYLVSRDLPFPNYDWNICIGQGRKIEFHTGKPFDDSGILASPNDLPSNEWVHVTCIASSVDASKRLYLDGQLVASANWTPHAFDNTAVPIYIGNSPGSEELHPYFPGDMDEVRIYDRALSIEEIQTVHMSNGTTTDTPTNGLLAYYPLNGDADDRSGNNQHGTAFHGVTYSRHLLGLAAHLSGDSQYISLPDTVVNGTDLTVAFWLKTGASTLETFPWGWFVVSRDLAFPNYDWNICIGQGRKIEFHTGTPTDDSFILRTPSDIPSNEWVHVTCVANSAGATKRVYLDGQLAASADWTPHAFANSGAPIYLMSATAGQELHPYLPGDIDEVLIFNRALPADEIEGLYKIEAVAIPPSIINQPSNQTATVGTGTTFSVVVSGPPPLRYQWRFDGTNIPGATNSTLMLFSVQNTNAGKYTAIVANDIGVEQSTPAVLQVNHPPVADASATPTLVLSANGTNATVVLDGSRSSDADGDLLGYFWSLAGLTGPLATSVVAIITLPVGNNAVSLTVSDGFAAATNTIVVEVLNSVGAVDRLVASVQSDVSRSAPLIATLSAALASIDRSNPTAALNQLQAFQNQIRAQLESLDFGLAQALVQKAQEVIDLLNALSGGTPGHGAGLARFDRLVRKPDGKVRVEFSTLSTRIYVVEASMNMLQWEPIGVATDLGEGKFAFEDPNAARFNHRFYRIVSP